MDKVVFKTKGNGYWSNVVAEVEIVDMRLPWVDEDEREFGELCVYFNTAHWDVKRDGLIYTDTQFKTDLNAFLAQHGLPAVDYSEQGMQGDDYVSCDVDKAFIKAWDAKFNTHPA